MTEAELSAIGATCGNIEAMATAEAEAREAEIAAAGDLLDRLAAKARPVVRVLGRRQVDYYWETSGANGCNPESRTTHKGPLAIMLIDLYDRRPDSTGNSGRFAGYRLLLTRDGFVEAHRSGQWSAWQGSVDKYEATFRPMTGADVAREWEATDAIEAIVAAVTKAAERTPETNAHKQRAERFAALARLV